MSHQSDEQHTGSATTAGDVRAEIARFLPSSAFPADGDRLLAVAVDNDATDEVRQRLARLPVDREFGSVDEVLTALDEP